MNVCSAVLYSEIARCYFKTPFRAVHGVTGGHRLETLGLLRKRFQPCMPLTKEAYLKAPSSLLWTTAQVPSLSRVVVVSARWVGEWRDPTQRIRTKGTTRRHSFVARNHSSSQRSERRRVRLGRRSSRFLGKGMGVSARMRSSSPTECTPYSSQYMDSKKGSVERSAKKCSMRST